MNDEKLLTEEEGGAAPNVTGGVAGKENVGVPAVRRKELEDSIAKAKDTAHRLVKDTKQ